MTSIHGRYPDPIITKVSEGHVKSFFVQSLRAFWLDQDDQTQRRPKAAGPQESGRSFANRFGLGPAENRTSCGPILMSAFDPLRTLA